jgi:uncharacterized membrane protein YeaQ/YmgE (transglycosylase-associated protein family)
MDVVGFLLLLVVAAILGTMGQALAGYSRGGCLLSAFVGIVGALLGGWIAGVVGLPELLVVNVGGWAIPVVYAVIGAALFSLVLGMLGRSRRGR